MDRDRELCTKAAKCHDSLWDGGKMDATEAFDEMCKFIFVKMQDELHPRKKGTPYDFQIKTNETPQSVHGRISRLYEEAKQHDPEVFSDLFSTNREKTFSIVNHLEGISLSKTDLDTKGVAFENFMEDFFKGKQGQFFTPREIVRFIIDMCEVDEKVKQVRAAIRRLGLVTHGVRQGCLAYGAWKIGPFLRPIPKTRTEPMGSDVMKSHSAQHHQVAKHRL